MKIKFLATLCAYVLGSEVECHNPPVVYRLHISRSYTVFYLIDEENEIVKIAKIETFEKAHKHTPENSPISGKNSLIAFYLYIKLKCCDF